MRLAQNLCHFSLVALCMCGPVQAHDYGVVGPSWEIAEDDLLTVIESRLTTLQATGALDALNTKMANRGRAYVDEPPPVDGIGQAKTTRSWLYDPSFTLKRDITNHKGRLIAAKGTRVNPLYYRDLEEPLVFVDADQDEQLAWALGHKSGKIILIKGRPVEVMEAHKRRVYFDQGGQLVRRFGIENVPAHVIQEGNLLRITEIVP